MASRNEARRRSGGFVQGITALRIYQYIKGVDSFQTAWYYYLS
jgi:hypothetical protein